MNIFILHPLFYISKQLSYVRTHTERRIYKSASLPSLEEHLHLSVCNCEVANKTQSQMEIHPGLTMAFCFEEKIGRMSAFECGRREKYKTAKLLSWELNPT